MNGRGETLRFRHVGLGSLAPYEVGIGSIGQAAIYGLLDTGLDVEKALARTLSCEEARVARIMVGEQQVRRIGVRAGDDHRGHAHDVGSQSRRHQLVDGLARGHQHLASQVPALLGG